MDKDRGVGTGSSMQNTDDDAATKLGDYRDTPPAGFDTPTPPPGYFPDDGTPIVLDTPPPYSGPVLSEAVLSESPLSSGMRHIGRALEALRSGSNVQMKISPEEKAACLAHIASVSPGDIGEDLMGAFRPDIEIVKSLLDGKTVQAGG